MSGLAGATTLFQFKHYSSEIKQLAAAYGTLPPKDVIEHHFPEYFDRHIVAVVFAGMIVEAFLYDYACVRKSNNYAEKVSDSSIDKEFLAIAKELLGRCSDEETEMAQELRNLNTVRRYYVHNKSVAADKLPPNKDASFGLMDCMKILHRLFEYFYRHDPDYHTSVVLLQVLRDTHKQERGDDLEMPRAGGQTGSP